MAVFNFFGDIHLRLNIQEFVVIFTFPLPFHHTQHTPAFSPNTRSHTHLPSRVCRRTSLCSPLGEICLWQSCLMTLKVQKKRCWGDGRRASNLQKRGKERMLTCSIICACALTRLTPLSLFFASFPPPFFRAATLVHQR